MKNTKNTLTLILGIIAILLSGCGDNASYREEDTATETEISTETESNSETDSETEDTSSDTETTLEDCLDAEIPFDECYGEDLIHYTGDVTLSNGECVFTAQKQECLFKQCTTNPDEDDVCWNPCDEIICDDPPDIDDECSGKDSLKSYSLENSATWMCDVVDTETQETECKYLTGWIHCENECIEVPNGPDYCI